MHLRSNSFRPYDFLADRLVFAVHDATTHVRFAGDRNPHLAWSDVPAGTRSFALWCVDPDAPTVGTDVNQPGRTVPLDLPRADFFHWVVADLPADLREIPEGSHAAGVVPHGKPAGATPSGGVTGLNDYTATPAQSRALFLDVMKRVNQLHAQPEYYDTFRNNCTINIVRHINTLAPGRVPYDYRVLLPGYADSLAYELGLIDNSLPFDEVRRRARITDRIVEYKDDPQFSARIRGERLR